MQRIGMEAKFAFLFVGYEVYNFISKMAVDGSSEIRQNIFFFFLLKIGIFAFIKPFTGNLNMFGL